MTTHIAIINHSSLVTRSALFRMTAVCALQLRTQACPLWGLEVPAISFASSDEELVHIPSVQVLGLFDDSDSPGALGWHDRTVMGLPYGRVFAKTIQENGGSLFEGANSISATMSHELLEMAWDPNCDMFLPGPDGAEFAREACDAVEADGYELSNGVWVSDFVLGDFFNQDAAPGAKLDFLGLVDRPFQTRPGGYQIVRKNGVVSSVFDERVPEWKRDGKSHPAARTARRLAESLHV